MQNFLDYDPPLCRVSNKFLSEQKVMVDLLLLIKSEVLGQFQTIITPLTQWSGWDTIYQRKDMRVFFPMKLVSFNLVIGLKRYGWSTSDYQNSPPKDRFENYLIFRGVLVIFPLPKSVQTLY